MRIINNQKGFSLTEIMVAVGLMGGVSLVTMKLVDDQAGNEKIIKSTAEVTKAVSLIQGALSNDKSCKSMLEGLNPTTAGIDLTTLRVVNPNGSFMELLSHNKNYGDFFLKTGDIKLFKIVDNASGTQSAKIVINFRVRKKGVKANFTTDTGPQSDTVITKTLPIEFKVAPPTSLTPAPGTIISCGAVLSEANELARKKFCASLDPGESESDLTTQGKGVSYWSVAQKKCNLNKMDCDYGYVPKDMTSMGSVNCVPLENAMDANSLNQIFDTTPVSCASHEFKISLGSDGRLKVMCN